MLLLFSEHLKVHFPDFPFLWNEGLNFITQQLIPISPFTPRPCALPPALGVAQSSRSCSVEASKSVSKQPSTSPNESDFRSAPCWFCPKHRRKFGFKTEGQSGDMRQQRKRKKQKEQTSTETMNNCIQKEEVKNEKEKEHGCDESVLKKAENSP